MKRGPSIFVAMGMIAITGLALALPRFTSASGVSGQNTVSNSSALKPAAQVALGTQVPTPAASIETLNAVETLESLRARVNETFVKPGWFYLKESVVYDHDRESNGVLPEGTVLVKEYTLEQWLHLDENKSVIEAVVIKRSLDGRILELRASNAVTALNLLTGDVKPSELSAYGSFEVPDYGIKVFETQLREGGPVGATVEPTTMEEIELDGKKVLRFVTREKMDRPVENSNFANPVAEVANQAYFDLLDGRLIALENVVTFADGSTRTYDHVKLEMGIQDTPPTEVSNYLAELEATK